MVQAFGDSLEEVEADAIDKAKGYFGDRPTEITPSYSAFEVPEFHKQVYPTSKKYQATIEVVLIEDKDDEDTVDTEQVRKEIYKTYNKK
jgi:hypothetical protein